MIHSASHFSISPLTRGKTAGAVARAAYIGRCRFHDARVGMTFSYGHLGGLLAEGAVNWVTGTEKLWNEIEAAETRKNSRVAREIKVALPAELPFDEMRRLVHGYCCNLKDRYGLVAQWAIHAPRFHNKDDGLQIERQYREGQLGHDDYFKILADPSRTNRNFHAHILKTTRVKDDLTGGFKDKIRCLDNIKSGPLEFQEMRAEWELRANSSLQRVGSTARVDLRSYREIAAAGDAPEGLTSQPHLGPKATNIARHRDAEADKSKPPSETSADDPSSVSEVHSLVDARKKTIRANDQIWASWLQRRALEREKARIEDSEIIATEREVARKDEAAKEKVRILDARTDQEAHDNAADAVHMSIPRGSFADIIARAQSGEAMEMPPSEDCELDLETFEREASETPFEDAIRVRVRSTHRVRS